MQTPDLHLELRPTARMAPWTLQALHLLELGTADLSDFVEAALLENPLLEREEHPFESTYAATGVHYEDGPLPEPAGEEGDRLDTLPAILLEQLEARALPKPLAALCAYMVELLDDDGYLQEEDLRHPPSGGGGGQGPPLPGSAADRPAAGAGHLRDPPHSHQVPAANGPADSLGPPHRSGCTAKK